MSLKSSEKSEEPSVFQLLGISPDSSIDMMFKSIVKRLVELEAKLSDMEEMQDWQSEEV